MGREVLSEITRDAVLQAVAEFDELGRDAFLDHYGFGRARDYLLVVDGKRYDSKAILGAAYGYDRPDEGPLTKDDFSGGAATTAARLKKLGFEVINSRSSSKAEPEPSVWWVNQGQTFKAERAGGYIWAPETDRNGRVLAHHSALLECQPGDFIVHYASGIRAIGIVQSAAESHDKPAALPQDSWGTPGNRVNVDYHDLETPIALEEIRSDVRAGAGGPFNTQGGVNQGYLYRLPESVASSIALEFAGRLPVSWNSRSVSRVHGYPTTDSASSSSLSLGEVVASFSAALDQTGLRFDAGLIRTFMTSLATKPFLILTGMSGSGKTRLAQAFGDFLGAQECLIAAVRPDWTSPDAILGYENGLSERLSNGYAWNVPSTLSFMLRAASDPDAPYVLILDEMNLAHVERYFADVLSGMESGHPILPNLIETSTGWRLSPDGPERLTLPSNLFMIGTVNVDETTYMFSPKVLDRANTIEFRVSTDSLEGSGKPIRPIQQSGPAVSKSFLRIARGEAQPRKDDSGLREQLGQIHKLLATHDREFGHRTFGEILRYSSLLLAAGEEELSSALDRQVLQKVLPKLHGSVRELTEPLNALAALSFHGPGNDIPEDFDPLDAPEADPALPLSFDKLRRMARRLRATHFVSFAE
jgi:5-methylcytosine-specific restriction enzyme B